MCLIVFAWQSHADYRLILAANRDELHRRPSKAAQWWADEPDILAGRDLQAGGTWLGVSRSGRFAAVTNYREGRPLHPGPRSRGELVTGYLGDNRGPGEFSESLDGDDYAGFSLLAADATEIACVSNRGDPASSLPPAIYGLSNASLDTPWSKIERSKAALSKLLDGGPVNETSLMRILADRTPAPVAEVHDDGLPFDLARVFTAPFIVSPDYGTRCSTIVLVRHDGETSFVEHRFDSDGQETGTSRFSFIAASTWNAGSSPAGCHS